MTDYKYLRGRHATKTQAMQSGFDEGKPKRLIIEIFKQILNVRILGGFGLKLVRSVPAVRFEQANWIDDQYLVECRNKKLANYIVEYFDRYEVNLDSVNLIKHISEFDQIFRASPISDLNGGLGYNNALILFLLVKKFSPTRILESGVWRGFSSYVLRSASREIGSFLVCCDINFSRLEYKADNAAYFEDDVSHVAPEAVGDIDFAFFDDHVSHYDRLVWSLAKGVEIVCVDDDVSLLQVHSDGWPPIPTSAMIFDELQLPHKVTWVSENKRREAHFVPLEAIQKIRKAYIRVPFPNLSEFTGYVNTSFTTLLFKVGGD